VLNCLSSPVGSVAQLSALAKEFDVDVPTSLTEYSDVYGYVNLELTKMHTLVVLEGLHRTYSIKRAIVGRKVDFNCVGFHASAIDVVCDDINRLRQLSLTHACGNSSIFSRSLIDEISDFTSDNYSRLFTKHDKKSTSVHSVYSELNQTLSGYLKITNEQLLLAKKEVKQVMIDFIVSLLAGNGTMYDCLIQHLGKRKIEKSALTDLMEKIVSVNFFPFSRYYFLHQVLQCRFLNFSFTQMLNHPLPANKLTMKSIIACFTSFLAKRSCSFVIFKYPDKV